MFAGHSRDYSHLPGVAVSQFPNMMLILGPNSANNWANLTTLVQVQATYNCKVIRRLKEKNAKEAYAMYPDPMVQLSWNKWIQNNLKGTVVLESSCSNYYTASTVRSRGIAAADVFARARVESLAIGILFMATSTLTGCIGRGGMTLWRSGSPSRGKQTDKVCRSLPRMYRLAECRLIYFLAHLLSHSRARFASRENSSLNCRGRIDNCQASE